MNARERYRRALELEQTLEFAAAQCQGDRDMSAAVIPALAKASVKRMIAAVTFKWDS